MQALTLHPMNPERSLFREVARLARGVPPAWLALVAMLPTLAWYVRRLNDGSDEPMGLVALAMAAAIAWRDRAAPRAGAAVHLSGCLLLLATVLAIGWLPPLVRAALAVTGVGLMAGFHRRPGLLGLLLLSLPVVASLQFYAGWPLRVATAEGVAGILKAGGITAAAEGVRISIGGSVIGVDPACAGVRMLWSALTAAMLLCAFHRVSWKPTFAATCMALVLVIPANIVRALWLVLEASGRMGLSGLGHGTVGLVTFMIILVPLAWMIPRHSNALMPRVDEPSAHPAARMILALACVALPWKLLSDAPAAPSPLLPPATPETFSFGGLSLPLEPIPPTAEEKAFSRSFPGSILSCRWNQDQVILRRVSQATRKLHPSTDCLRAAGYRTSDAETVTLADGSVWSRFTAARDGRRLTVHERIVSETDGSTWTDVPAWYWSALNRPLNGPWRAETVISE